MVNDWLEKQTNNEDGTDLADVYISKFKEVENKYTDAELIINEIEQHTPDIWKLIKTFGLVNYHNNDIRKVIK